jgi:hypothetical protein
MGKGLDGQAEGSGQTKVCYFEGAFVADQQVLWFKVSVDDPSAMAVVNSVA